MRLSVALGLVVTAGATALADPRETISFSDVQSDGLEGEPANTVLTAPVVGGYGVSKVRITATLNSINPATYQSEAVFKVTPPGSPAFYVQMSGVDDEFTTLTFTDVELYLPEPVAQAAGTWEVRFFETYNDAGVDAVWSSFSMTLDDDAPGHFETTDAGSFPATADVPQGSGPLNTISGSVNGDEDLYKIQVCDPANFTASTVGGTTLDTRLFIFDVNGNGVLFNDDYEASPEEYYLQSRIHNTGGLTAGEYYLGVSVFQRMATDSEGQVLWNNTPYETVRAPDGPGAANPVTGWTGSPFESGAYLVVLTGACYVGPALPPCGTQDFNGDGDFGTDQDIEAFFACITGDCCSTCCTCGQDFNGDGDFGTDQDVEAFFRVLAGAPCR